MFQLSVMRTYRVYSCSVSCRLSVVRSLQAQAPLPIIPLPATAVQGTGSLLVDHGLQVVFEGYTEPRWSERECAFGYAVRETGVRDSRTACQGREVRHQNCLAKCDSAAAW